MKLIVKTIIKCLVHDITCHAPNHEKETNNHASSHDSKKYIPDNNNKINTKTLK